MSTRGLSLPSQAHSAPGALQRLREGNRRFVQNVRSVDSMLNQVARRALTGAQTPAAIISLAPILVLRRSWSSIRGSGTCFPSRSSRLTASGRNLDHAGGCERILRTPIPHVYSVTIRRFIVIYLFALPFALAAPVGFLSPAYMMLIAYPIRSLEQIGAELQNPFVTRSLSRLDLEAFCEVIERDVRVAAAVLSSRAFWS